MSLEVLLILLSIAIFLGLLACLEIGYRNALRRAETERGATHEGISAIEAAVFGLLGLLLAFSLAGATGRLDARRDLIVKEVNTIETALLRVALLPEDSQRPIRQLFRDYVEARTGVYRYVHDEGTSNAHLARSLELQHEIWSRCLSEARLDPNGGATLLLLPAINDMIDVTTARSIALGTHLPSLIFSLLVIVAFLSALLAGYAMARRQRRSWLHMVLYAGIIAVTIYTVLDLENPRIGLVRLDAADRAMTKLLESIQ